MSLYLSVTPSFYLKIPLPQGQGPEAAAPWSSKRSAQGQVSTQQATLTVLRRRHEGEKGTCFIVSGESVCVWSAQGHISIQQAALIVLRKGQEGEKGHPVYLGRVWVEWGD